MAKEPVRWVGLGQPCRTLPVGWDSRGFREPWKVLEQRRGAATSMMSRIFWGRRGAGLEGRQKQDPRTRPAWNLGIF